MHKWEKARKKYKGRKLTKKQLAKLDVCTRMAICECDFCIPGPVWVEPKCPIHWSLAKDGKVTQLG